VLLDGATLAENLPAGTLVGTLSAVDPDAGDTHLFTLVPGSGDGDNGSFVIIGDQLQAAQPLDFETQPSLSIRVEADDQKGGRFEKAFTVSVDDTAEPPAVAIDEPTAGAVLIHGAASAFSGSALDPEQGDVSAALAWSSDLDGTIGAGASFSTSSLSEGFHTITAAAIDAGGLMGQATVAVEVTAAPLLTTEIRVAAPSDDAEENASGTVFTGSSDLELIFDGGSDQTVGMRFVGVDVPKDANISGAWIQFQVDETPSGTTTLTLRGEAADDAATFTTAPGDLSTRPVTAAFVPWSPPAWGTVGEADLDQRTPDIAPLIQTIVERDGWASGNALVILVTGSGERVAESFNGDSDGAPLLHIEYTAD